MRPPPARLRNIPLPQLTTEAQLAAWFGLQIRHLQWRADITGQNRQHPAGPLRQYRYRWIPKRQGSPRLLEIPKAPLKQMQRQILQDILNLLPPHPAAHGFCPNRSILTNAAPHCGKEAVLRFDLRDFFPSVTAARVLWIFRTLGYPVRVARLLTALCTTTLPTDIWNARPGPRTDHDFEARQKSITRHLPQGAPTSPALANLAALRLDRRLTGLARQANLTYTRYADDLTFSGGPDLAKSRKNLELLVAVIAHEEGFSLNHKKTRLMRQGTRQSVTGVVVNTHPNIKRTDFDQLKAILTNCIKHGPPTQNRNAHPNFQSHLAGRIAQVTNIHPQRGKRLWELFGRIKWDGGAPLELHPQIR